MLLGHPEMAVGIVFGTSVGAMTTVIGFIALAGPIEDGPPQWRRIWPFQLVACILVLIVGFKGFLDYRDAIALIVQGLVMWFLWNDHPQPTPQSVLENAWSGNTGAAAGLAPASNSDPGADPALTGSDIALLAVQLILTAALLWLGSWSITKGAVHTSQHVGGLSTSGLAGSVISLSMVLPMMYGAWRHAEGGRGWAPLTTQIGVVLLNLCILLPLLILIPYIAVKVPQVAHWAGDTLEPRGDLPTLLIFPSPMWRVDNVILIVVGVLLLPVSIGKWRLGREEGMILMAGYFFYLTTTLAGGLERATGH
jgi:Ca2+/Na+ antiporter